MNGARALLGAFMATTGCQAQPVVAPPSESPASAPPNCREGAGAIPPGTAITVDGVVGPDEWLDATEYTIDAGPGWTVPVLLKRDDHALAILFRRLKSPTTSKFGFPEVMLDIGDDKAEFWTPEDRWFHVSLTDCAAAGTYDDYDGCVPEAEGWQANNFPQGHLIEDVEMRIELATLGLTAATPAEFGLALRVSDTQDFARHWPPNATPDVPSSWGTARICP